MEFLNHPNDAGVASPPALSLCQVDRPLSRNAADLLGAASGESQLAADDQIADGARDEHLPGTGHTHDAGGEVNREAGDVLTAALDFTRLQSRTTLEPEALGPEDDLLGAAHPLTGTGEEGEQAVARRLDRLTAVRRDRLPRVA